MQVWEYTAFHHICFLFHFFFVFFIFSLFVIISISASGELFWEMARQKTNSHIFLLLSYLAIRPWSKWTRISTNGSLCSERLIVECFVEFSSLKSSQLILRHPNNLLTAPKNKIPKLLANKTHAWLIEDASAQVITEFSKKF